MSEGPKKYGRYPCDQCEFSTQYMANLKKHRQAKHDGVRYQCNLCGHSSTTEFCLRKHKFNKHLGVKHPCDLCGFSSKSAAALTVHKKAKHAVEGEINQDSSEILRYQIKRINPGKSVKNYCIHNEHLLW